jgi:hypothetical protein
VVPACKNEKNKTKRKTPKRPKNPNPRQKNRSIRGTIRSSGGQVDNIQWMGPTTITSTWYARSSAASGAWPFTTRRGINTLAQTDPSFTVGTVPIRNIATLYTNSAIGVMGSGRRAANALSGNSNGFGVQSRTRKASALAMAGGPGGGR